MENEIIIPDRLPLLPIKKVVIFPSMVIPLFVGRDASIAAVDHALSGDRMVVFATQKDASVEAPTIDDIYSMGTVGQIHRMIKQPDGKVKILIQGVRRARISKLTEENNLVMADVEIIEKLAIEEPVTLEAQMRSVKELLLKLVGMGKPVLPDFVEMLDSMDDADKLSDVLASNLSIEYTESQELLAMVDPVDRLQKLTELFNRELSIMEVQQKIVSSTKGEIDKVQREYFLREQLKAIQKELGMDDSSNAEIEEFEAKIKGAKMSKDAEEEAMKQLKRLSTMSQDSAEGAVIRTYLDWLIDIPWSKRSKERLDMRKAKSILNDDHYGMEDVKERVLDFLALRKLKKDVKSPILCLVGPPGVGKTSLGQSIARALNREFSRMSFGGMRDEAEIRGHRRTYIGAMPGKIIQALKSVKVNNPVIMLDEIDKLGSDFRGDPSSALLEVLDPVQNNTFTDHYIGLPFDLSRIMFITTANYLDPIPAPLRDRMEIIRLSGYTDDEKLQIVKRYIIPRQLKESGLDKFDIKFREDSLKEIISGYTRESGLRKLEQVISAVCRKIGRQVVEDNIKVFDVDIPSVRKYLGQRENRDEQELQKNEIGIVTGLAWTPVGGEVLYVECSSYNGKGAIIQTGMMGDVMKESIKTAMTYIRVIAPKHKIDDKLFETKDIHVHMPAGAIPKDGPSAGITIATAIFSALTQRPVKKDVAMTGEITITGKVLPIGGLKEKLFAAMRLGIKTVIIPKENEAETEKLPEAIKKSLKIVPVSRFDEVLKVAITK